MKKASLILGSVLIATMLISYSGCVSSRVSSSSNNSPKSKEVTIGEQVWMTENLNVDKFRNGDSIPHAKTKPDWQIAATSHKPAWCYYEHDSTYGAKYGKLYNWYALNDPRGLAPEGWHIPSIKEWFILFDYLGGEKVAGVKMKSTSGWDAHDGGSGNGTNTSGFSGLPGGYCSHTHGFFKFVGKNGGWWTSTEKENSAWYVTLYNSGSDAQSNYAYKNKGNGFSVRCLRD